MTSPRRPVGSLARLAAVLAVSLAVFVAGCGGGRATPEETFASLRSALRAGADARLLELHDAETRAFFRQRVRTARARVATGESESAVAAAEGVTAGVFLEGDLDEAAAHEIARGSHLDLLRPYLLDGTIVGRTDGEPPSGGPCTVTLRVRAVDGTERDVYFVRDRDGWALDAYRHFQESLRPR